MQKIDTLNNGRVKNICAPIQYSIAYVYCYFHKQVLHKTSLVIRNQLFTNLSDVLFRFVLFICLFVFCFLFVVCFVFLGGRQGISLCVCECMCMYVCVCVLYFALFFNNYFL